MRWGSSSLFEFEVLVDQQSK